MKSLETALACLMRGSYIQAFGRVGPAQVSASAIPLYCLVPSCFPRFSQPPAGLLRAWESPPSITGDRESELKEGSLCPHGLGSEA